LTQDISCYARTLMQLCVWRESRGDEAAWSAVAWVILNRAMRRITLTTGTFGSGVLSLDEAIQHVVTAHEQFSSMTVKGDVNTVQWPLPSVVWAGVAAAVDAVLNGMTPDPTAGATFYFSLPLLTPPEHWGEVTKTLDVGGIQFWRPALA
jgi:hypothetical protein